MISGKLKRAARLGKKKIIQILRASEKGHGGVVFVAGHQRSGTNMVMNVLERSLQTDVFHERDSRAFVDYQMRGPETIRALVDGSVASHFVIKALCELQDLPDLMQQFAPAKVIWVYRGYHDVVNSMVRSFQGFKAQFEAIAEDRDAAGWRGLGMSDRTHEVVQNIATHDISEASAAAMQWYYRNCLFFEQNFQENPAVLVTAYENQVTEPDAEFKRIFDFLELEYTPEVAKTVFSSSVRRNEPPEIDPEVERLCAQLYQNFVALNGNR